MARGTFPILLVFVTMDVMQTRSEVGPTEHAQLSSLEPLPDKSVPVLRTTPDGPRSKPTHEYTAPPELGQAGAMIRRLTDADR